MLIAFCCVVCGQRAIRIQPIFLILQYDSYARLRRVACCLRKMCVYKRRSLFPAMPHRPR